MKNQAILLGAVLLAFSPELSAQNAVGYFNTALGPGFSLIENPLIAPDNSIASLFRNVTPALPDKFGIFFLGTNGYRSVTFDAASGTFGPAEAAVQQILPGQGVFVFNPGQSVLTVTFVGQIPQGHLSNAIPQGLSMVSSMIPRSGTTAELGFPAEQGDFIYVWNAKTQKFQTSWFDDVANDWLPPSSRIDSGEAFFVRKARPTVWEQTLAVANFAARAQTSADSASGTDTQSFDWLEDFAPFPLEADETLVLTLRIIPPVQAQALSTMVSLETPVGETFLSLSFQDGLLNGVSSYKADSWNDLAITADLNAQTYEITLNGSASGPFALGPGASLATGTTSVSALHVNIAGQPGTEASAWFDNVKLTLSPEGVTLFELDFEKTQPRFTPTSGTLDIETNDQ